MMLKINLFDLPFYKGKKIMTYNGSDARQNLNKLKNKFVDEIYETGHYKDEKRSKAISKRINKVAKYVDHIFFVNPDLMYFLPKEKSSFLPYTVAGFEEIPESKYDIGDKIKILHAPTNRLLKGSCYILNALANIKKKYSNVEVILIEKIPYEEALKLYKEAHIVIDQVLIGWYGAFGVEVMKMGKPLAVYIREEDLHIIPEEMASDLKKSVININKNDIEKKLSYYIENHNLLYEKSQKCLNYVNKWHDPLYVASLTSKVYNA